MSYNKIQATLESTLRDCVTVPISWENVHFIEPDDSSWVRQRFMPSDRRPRMIGQDVDGTPLKQRYTGIYQVIVAVPEGTGREFSDPLISSIISAFDSTKDLTIDNDLYVTILQTEKMRAYQDSPWYKTPINIHWYTYAK